MGNFGLHARHCCAEHGCKFFYVDCPVVLGKVEQMYPCEDCDGQDEKEDEAIHLLSQMYEAVEHLQNKDWLDPSLERAVKEYLRKHK